MISEDSQVLVFCALRLGVLSCYSCSWTVPPKHATNDECFYRSYTDNDKKERQAASFRREVAIVFDTRVRA